MESTPNTYRSVEEVIEGFEEARWENIAKLVNGEQLPLLWQADFLRTAIQSLLKECAEQIAALKSNTHPTNAKGRLFRNSALEEAAQIIQSKIQE